MRKSLCLYGYGSTSFTVAGDAGDRLSGGERQRITIARAVLKKASVVILDEATAYADPESESLIQQAIGKLVRGKTLITIAHRLTTVRDADHILVVEGGRIAQRGTHEELAGQPGIYSNFLRLRSEAIGWRL